MKKLLKFATSEFELYYATSLEAISKYFSKKPAGFNAVYCGSETLKNLARVGRGVYKEIEKVEIAE